MVDVDFDQTVEMQIIVLDTVTRDMRAILYESDVVAPEDIGELADTLASYMRAMLKLTRDPDRVRELIGQ